MNAVLYIRRSGLLSGRRGAEILGANAQMLSLNKKTDYASNALVHLARNLDRVSSAREISGLYDLPLPIITNVLKTLTRAGLVTSTRGARGGYELASPPAEITLFDLLTATEGPYGFVRCLEAGSDPCPRQEVCLTRGPARRIHDQLKSFLKSVTLEELARENGSLDEPRTAEVDSPTRLHDCPTEQNS